MSKNRRFCSRGRLEHQQEEAGGEAGAEHRAGDGDPAVGPAAVTLALDGQDGVGAAGAEVAGGVHRVAGGAAEGHAQGHDEARDGPGADGAGGGCHGTHLEGVALEADRQDDEHEERRGNELGQEVPPRVPDGRHRAEGAEHRVRLVGRGVVVVLVEDVHEEGADEAAEHLGDAVAEHLAPRELARDGEAQGDGRVQVSAGHRAGDEHAHHHGEAPREGDDDPSAAFRLGLVQRCGGAHAVTEEDQYEGPDEFEDISVHSLTG